MYGDKWIIAGGASSAGDIYSDAVEWDPVANSWAHLDNMVDARSSIQGATLGDKLYVVGGWLNIDGYPDPLVSSTVQSYTDVKCRSCDGYRILIVNEYGLIAPSTLQAELQAQAGVSMVDVASEGDVVSYGVDLGFYDMVVTVSRWDFYYKIQLGNLLADYADAGGIVFLTDLSNNYSSILGRFQTEAYSPFPNVSSIPTSTPNNSLGSYTQGQPLMEGVVSLQAGYWTSHSLSTGATGVANWVLPAGSTPLIAFKGNVVAASAYLGEDNPTNFSGDWATLIVNAVRWIKPDLCLLQGAMQTMPKSTLR
jgi:hypothetical protein